MMAYRKPSSNMPRRLNRDLTNMILSFLNSGYLLKELNQTNIVLLPKVEDPKTLKDYKPISLCNVAIEFFLKFYLTCCSLLCMRSFQATKMHLYKGGLFLIILFSLLSFFIKSGNKRNRKNSGPLTKFIFIKL